MAVSAGRGGTSAPQGAPTRGEQTAAVVRRYTTGGQTMESIARDLGMSLSKVHRLLAESGTPRRPSGPDGTSAPQGSPRREEQTAEVVRRYTTGGQSVERIARDTGMSPSKVYGLLVESGTPRRSRGWSPAFANKTSSPRRAEQTAEVVRRYTTGGQTIQSIAQDTGMSYSKVRKLLVETGTPRRRGGELTGEVVRQYTTGGQTIRSIARDMGLSYCKVRCLLIKSGTPLRPRGGRRQPVGEGEGGARRR